MWAVGWAAILVTSVEGDWLWLWSVIWFGSGEGSSLIHADGTDVLSIATLRSKGPKGFEESQFGQALTTAFNSAHILDQPHFLPSKEV